MIGAGLAPLRFPLGWAADFKFVDTRADFDADLEEGIESRIPSSSEANFSLQNRNMRPVTTPLETVYGLRLSVPGFPPECVSACTQQDGQLLRFCH